MSILASTDIVLKELPPNPLVLLDILVDYGWRFNDSNCISYLPLGDKDDFSWKSLPLTELASLKHELEEKVKASELIGICLTWQDTAIGGQLLLDLVKKNLGFVWNINRRRKSNSDRYTDFSWYEEKIVQALKNSNIEIASVYSKDIE